MRTRTLLGKIPLLLGVAASVALLAGSPAVRGAEAKPRDVPFPVIERFENFRLEQGLPSHKVHAVLKASDGRLWIGTYDGLVTREDDGKFRRYGPEEGLSHKMVMCLAEDPRSGDLWVGTLRGLNRFSASRITSYTQTDSGLPNNVVYGVGILDDRVWVATAAGAGSLDPKTGAWKIYDHNNSIMHEPWCYAIAPAKSLVYVGVWGGGIVEHNPKLESFKAYRDPDGDFHFDLVPDDGPINDITSWLTWEDGILWQATYFGLSRYDGTRWRTWVETKTPLVSNFVNFVAAWRRVAWVGTDRGVSVTDGTFWVNYLVGNAGEGSLTIHRPDQPAETRSMTTALANGFVLGIWLDDREAWFATSNGLSRGVYAPGTRFTQLSATDAGNHETK